MTVRVLKSPSSKWNDKIVEFPRNKNEDNVQWIRRALGRNLVGKDKNQSILLLVGGNDPLSFRLRVAQSHVRHDLSPSAWSHVAFVRSLSGDVAKAPTVEISLSPANGFGRFGHPSPSNGIQEGSLAQYQSADLYPNIAIIAAPIASPAVESTLRDLRFQRSSLDTPQLILRWLAYCWGVGVPASPLSEGVGMPSAALLEVAFAANGFDLTPGIESRSSCPEAIWQAARWWQEYYKSRGKNGKEMKGAFIAKHDLVPEVRYENAEKGSS